MTNVSYRRFKQSDFHNSSFIVDILSFLVQNFNPVNLDIKLDLEKERDMVKFLWDECIPHEFVTFLYKGKYYEEISQPNLTYQKANKIVKEYLVENPQRINQLKFKIEEKFNLIHYIYSSLFSKIYNRTNTFGIKRKNNFKFNFQLWKRKKIQKNATFFVFLKKNGNNQTRNEQNNEKIDKRKRKQRSPLNLDEKMLVLAERLRKKDVRDNLHKASTDNIPFFNRNRIIKKSEVKYWVEEDDKKIDGRFFREELFALNNQFLR